jgi:hypothetical protein
LRWVTYVFDHPVSEPAWWWDSKRPTWSELAHPGRTIDYLTRLFADPGSWSSSFSSDQIGQGLWFLFDPSCSDHLRPLMDRRLEVKLRVQCVGAISRLYSRLLARVCHPEFGHLATGESKRSVNATCYMLWDLAVLQPRPDVPSERPVDDACLQVMRATLKLNHLACQESALHGLGHWHHGYPTEVEDIVNEFLAATSGHASTKLLAYARSARRGCVL